MIVGVREDRFAQSAEEQVRNVEVSYLFGSENPHATVLRTAGFAALIDEQFACICICPRDDMYEKVISNMQEMKARGGKIIAVATEGDKLVRQIADDVIEVPDNLEMVSPILNVVPLQLFAYYFASANGREIDKPRNLAKSVTVE